MNNEAKRLVCTGIVGGYIGFSMIPPYAPVITAVFGLIALLAMILSNTVFREN